MNGFSLVRLANSTSQYTLFEDDIKTVPISLVSLMLDHLEAKSTELTG